jgi:DNA invertase Pin-like site-specific DNA recombinase
LSRSIKDPIQMSELLKSRQVGLRSLQETSDTTTSGGQLIFHIVLALAEFERNLIRERTSAGLVAAKAKSWVGGRPKTLDLNQRTLVINLYHDGHHTVDEICQMMGVSNPTLFMLTLLVLSLRSK